MLHAHADKPVEAFGQMFHGTPRPPLMKTGRMEHRLVMHHLLVHADNAAAEGGYGRCSLPPSLSSKMVLPKWPASQPTQSACSCPAATFRPEPAKRALAIDQALDASKDTCLPVCRCNLFTLSCPVGQPVLDCSLKTLCAAPQHVVPNCTGTCQMWEAALAALFGYKKYI